MANEISKLITPDGVSHDIKDSVARQASYDVSNKVNKTGDTMTGPLALLGSELQLKTTGSSSNDSGDIVWFYGNGQEKARIWTGDTPTGYGESRLNFRSYKSDGSALHNTQLATASDVDAKISRSGDVMTGALVALAFTASANGSPTIVSQSTDVDASKADNNISSDRYPAWVASDKYGRILTRMECVASSNGNIAAYWYVRNYNTSGSQVAQKGIKMSMDKSGNMSYTVDDNGKFRTALGLATVASTGSYNDLSNKPTIPDISGKVDKTGDPTVFKTQDIPEGAANLSATATTHRVTIYRNGFSIPYQMDNPNDGGILRVRGTSESNCILELGTWDDSGSGETIQFNYYPTTSQVTPTYSVSVPKASGTIALTSQLPSVGTGTITRQHASVSSDAIKCYTYGKVVIITGSFACGATIAANTILYNVPKPYGSRVNFTWSGSDFWINTDGSFRTNGQITSRTYYGTITYISA